MENLCRICLGKSGQRAHIFVEQWQVAADEKVSLAEMLQSCVDCKIKRDDNLPKWICLSCSSDMLAAYKFKRRCEQTHKLLVKLVDADFDTFCEMLESEDWELPKRLTDGDSIKIEPEENTARGACDSNSEKRDLSTDEPQEHNESRSQSGTETSEKSLEFVVHAKCHEQLECREGTLKSNNSLPRMILKHDDTQMHFGESPHQSSDSLKAVAKKKSRRRTSRVILSLKCPHCSKRLCDRSTLRRHVRLHTGEHPFNCSLCPLKFTRSDHLKIHIRRYHNNDDTKAATRNIKVL